MKKLIKKLICMTLAVACVLTSVACFGEEDAVKIDKTKTQLYVGIVPSGYGTSWLYDLIDKFENEYKDYEFEPGTGKKGAQVIVKSL